MSLAARAITFAYPGAVSTLRGITLQVERGELVALIGANGSGKSTLIRLFSGYLPPVQGRVFLDGTDLEGHSPRFIAQRLATLEQQPVVSLDFRVRDVVAMGRLPHAGPLGRLTEADRSVIDDALHMTDTQRLSGRPIHTLSGGEQQRVFLAMALAQTPRYLLLDEPTSHLDIRYQMELLEIIRRQADAGLGVVVALHDLNTAARVSDRIAILNDGRMLAEGSPSDVLTPELLGAAFCVAVSVRFDTEWNQWIILPRDPQTPNPL